MDFVVEGQCLPVHSTVVAQSEVLRCALRDTKNEGRTQLKSPFETAKISVVDDFLCQAYVTDIPFPDDLTRSRDVIELAMHLGFDPLVRLGIRNLEKDRNLETKLVQGQEDSDFVCWWLRIVQHAPTSVAYRVVTKFLAEHCSPTIGEGTTWGESARAIISKEMALDVASAMHDIMELWKEKTCVLSVYCSSCTSESSDTMYVKDMIKSESVPGEEIQNANVEAACLLVAPLEYPLGSGDSFLGHVASMLELSCFNVRVRFFHTGKIFSMCYIRHSISLTNHSSMCSLGASLRLHSIFRGLLVEIPSYVFRGVGCSLLNLRNAYVSLSVVCLNILTF